MRLKLGYEQAELYAQQAAGKFELGGYPNQEIQFKIPPIKRLHFFYLNYLKLFRQSSYVIFSDLSVSE